MATSATTNLPTNDVLHSEEHSHLSAEEIAKAVARHKREHPDHGPSNLPAKSQMAASRCSKH